MGGEHRCPGQCVGPNTRSFKHDQIAIDPDGKILQSRWKKAVGKF